MKKLMMIVCAALAGAVQAATFTWKTNGVLDYSGGDSISSVAIMAYASSATAADAIKVVDAEVSETFLNYTYDWTGAVEGTTYNFYLIFVDGDKKFDSSLSTPTVIATGTASSMGDFVGFDSDDLLRATCNTDNWHAVPEPTSGLLLLVGGALLALKRRQALGTKHQTL